MAITDEGIGFTEWKDFVILSIIGEHVPGMLPIYAYTYSNCGQRCGTRVSVTGVTVLNYIAT